MPAGTRCPLCVAKRQPGDRGSAVPGTVRAHARRDCAARNRRPANLALSRSTTSKRARAGRGTTASALQAAPASLCLCHGGSRPAEAGGRLLHPGEAQAAPLEASGIRRTIPFPMASADPFGRSDSPASADRVIATRGKESRALGRQDDAYRVEAMARSRENAPADARLLSPRRRSRARGRRTISPARIRPSPASRAERSRSTASMRRQRGRPEVRRRSEAVARDLVA